MTFYKTYIYDRRFFESGRVGGKNEKMKEAKMRNKMEKWKVWFLGRDNNLRFEMFIFSAKRNKVEDIFAKRFGYNKSYVEFDWRDDYCNVICRGRNPYAFELLK